MMRLSSRLSRISLVFLVLHGVFAGSSLRAEPPEERAVAAAPNPNCAKKFARVSFGLKTAFVAVTIAALLAHNYGLQSEITQLHGQLAQVDNILASQDGVGNSPQILAWQAELKALTPSERAKALDAIYQLARKLPRGAAGTYKLLLEPLPVEEQVAAWQRAWLQEDERGKRFGMFFTGDFPSAFNGLDPTAANKVLASMLDKVDASKAADRIDRIYDISTLLNGASDFRDLSPENVTRLLKLGPEVVAFRGQDYKDIQSRYVSALAHSSSSIGIEGAMELTRKLWAIEQPGKWYLGDGAENTISALVSNPHTPVNDLSIALFVRQATSSNSFHKVAEFLDRQEVPEASFTPHVNEENAGFFLSSLKHEVTRPRYNQAPLQNTVSYRNLAKVAVSVLAKSKKPVALGEHRTSIQEAAEIEIAASGKDSKDSKFFREHLAEAFAQSMELKDGPGFSYELGNGLMVLGPKMDVTLTEKQWDRAADGLFMRPTWMIQAFAATSPNEKPPPERLQPLLDRLIRKMESQDALSWQGLADSNAMRIRALAGVTLRDPAALPKETVMGWVKKLPPESHRQYPVRDIVSGEFFEER